MPCVQCTALWFPMPRLTYTTAALARNHKHLAGAKNAPEALRSAPRSIHRLQPQRAASASSLQATGAAIMCAAHGRRLARRLHSVRNMRTCQHKTARHGASNRMHLHSRRLYRVAAAEAVPPTPANVRAPCGGEQNGASYPNATFRRAAAASPRGSAKRGRHAHCASAAVRNLPMSALALYAHSLLSRLASPRRGAPYRRLRHGCAVPASGSCEHRSTFVSRGGRQRCTRTSQHARTSHVETAIHEVRPDWVRCRC